MGSLNEESECMKPHKIKTRHTRRIGSQSHKTRRSTRTPACQSVPRAGVQSSRHEANMRRGGEKWTYGLSPLSTSFELLTDSYEDMTALFFSLSAFYSPSHPCFFQFLALGVEILRPDDDQDSQADDGEWQSLLPQVLRYFSLSSFSLKHCVS